ncbi:hypothetical protein GCM10018779_27760 [Streptomyces griseocarneus]|nr:hypothetical protein GCM10018779_27760 [Streptomyces griseocarneus]
MSNFIRRAATWTRQRFVHPPDRAQRRPVNDLAYPEPESAPGGSVQETERTPRWATSSGDDAAVAHPHKPTGSVSTPPYSMPFGWRGDCGQYVAGARR